MGAAYYSLFPVLRYYLCLTKRGVRIRVGVLCMGRMITYLCGRWSSLYGSMALLVLWCLAIFLSGFRFGPYADLKWAILRWLTRTFYYLRSLWLAMLFSTTWP